MPWRFQLILLLLSFLLFYPVSVSFKDFLLVFHAFQVVRKIDVLAEFDGSLRELSFNVL